MRSAHISRRQAEAQFDGVDVEYDEVFAVQSRAVQLTDAEELAGALDLLDEIDDELEAAALAALSRVPRFTDPCRAGRSRRRADRAVLRSLPVRIEAADVIDGEAA
jgi:hypothetical protein